MADAVLDVLDLIAVPAFVIDVLAGERLVIRKINAAHEAMSGLCDNALAGRGPYEVFPARLAETLTDNYLRVVRTGEAYSYQELLDLSRGEEWWQTTLMPVRGDGGAVVRIIGTGINISEQKRAEIERAETLATAHALNEEIEETLAFVAHDLRSPLVSIQAMVREVKRGFVDLNDGKRAMLDQIEAIGRKASSLVEEMLLYRDTGGLTPVVSCFDFGHSVADIAALLDPLSKHFIHFNNIEIEGDALALQIVLRNLVDNAIRHSDRRELMIAIDVVENEPGVLTFTVGDNGNGLLGPDIQRINGNETASPAGDSYGFRGVRRLVRSRGGDVWTGAPLFASGATVHFTLPGRILGERTASASRAA